MSLAAARISAGKAPSGSRPTRDRIGSALETDNVGGDDFARLQRDASCDAILDQNARDWRTGADSAAVCLETVLQRPADGSHAAVRQPVAAEVTFEFALRVITVNVGRARRSRPRPRWRPCP